jgi:hypothetical protein
MYDYKNIFLWQDLIIIVHMYLRDVPRENQKISHIEKHEGQPILNLTP